MWGVTLSRYACSLENVVSSVRINNIGRFRIRATTRRTIRYESVYTDSPIEYGTNPRTPVIQFPTDFQRHVTFGQTYTLNEASFVVPTNTPHPAENGVTITY